MMRIGLLVAGGWWLAACASRPAAGSTSPATSDRPPATSLVVAITVDQLRGDYLWKFGPQLHGGLGRLVREGAVFRNAYQDHGMTETAPGHATVLSGRNPSSTGILRNSEGVSDSASPLLEVNGAGASPRRFRGTVLFDWMRERWPAARALSVAGKDRSAILPLGRSHEAVFWYAGGQFTTSRWYAEALPEWVRGFNRRVPAARRPGREWVPLLALSAYPEPDSVPYENRGRDFLFPHRLPADSAQAARAFLATPWPDSITLELALEGISQMQLGTGAHPDLVHIGLSATDGIGHAYGPDSRELHDQVLRLDRAIGLFLDSLSRLRDPRRIVLVLTADHGVTSFPEYSREHGNPRAAYLVLDTMVRRWRDTLTARAGAGTWIPFAEGGFIAIDRAGLAARGVNVDDIVARMRAELLATPGVGRVDTRASIAAADTARDTIARRWRNAITPDSKGELFVQPIQGVVLSGPGGSADHGLVSDDDAHVTLAFWGAGIRHRTVTSRTSVTDIAPTLARLLGVAADTAVHGRVLREVLR